MSDIFISYRRDDNPDAAGRIYDRLRDHFGEESVFFDIDAVPFGLDFREHVDIVVSKCDILLVVIGDAWLSADDQGQSRLENPADFVRIEVEAALKRDIPVVPVPVGNASIPKVNELPKAISDLSYRNAAEVRSGTAFQGHIQRLIRGIESILAAKPGPESVSESEPEQEPALAKERQRAEAERKAQDEKRQQAAKRKAEEEKKRQQAEEELRRERVAEAKRNADDEKRRQVEADANREAKEESRQQAEAKLKTKELNKLADGTDSVAHSSDRPSGSDILRLFPPMETERRSERRYIDKFSPRKAKKTVIGAGIAAGVAIIAVGTFVVPSYLQGRRIDNMGVEVGQAVDDGMLNRDRNNADEQNRPESLRSELERLIDTPAYDASWDAELLRVMQDLENWDGQSGYLGAIRVDIALLYADQANIILAENQFVLADQLLDSAERFAGHSRIAGRRIIMLRGQLKSARNAIVIDQH